MANPTDPENRVVRSDAEWRARLTPEQYRVTRQRGTEAPFSGEYWDTKTPGIYRCVACGEPLFDSGAKYESGTGWPSFREPLPGAPIALETDRSQGMERVEARCAACAAHLGHVFPDGPGPQGTRFCMNSAALRLEPRPDPDKPPREKS